MSNLPDYISRCVVSSVLNRDVKQYGKANLFDNNPESCWNSDSGSPQWILIGLNSRARISDVVLQFQGGFAALEVELQMWNEETKDTKECHTFYPANANSAQSFVLSNREGQDLAAYSNCCIVFKKSSDFFGRIIVYKLQFHLAET